MVVQDYRSFGFPCYLGIGCHASQRPFSPCADGESISWHPDAIKIWGYTRDTHLPACMCNYEEAGIAPQCTDPVKPTKRRSSISCHFMGAYSPVTSVSCGNFLRDIKSHNLKPDHRYGGFYNVWPWIRIVSAWSSTRSWINDSFIPIFLRFSAIFLPDTKRFIEFFVMVFLGVFTMSENQRE